MNSKHISAAVGFTGFGALVAWAFTADRYEQKMKDQADTDQVRIAYLRDLAGRLDERCQELEALVNIVVEYGEDTPEDDENAPESDAAETVVTDEVPEMTEEEEAQTRTNLQAIIEEYTGDPDVTQEFIDTSTQALKVDRTPPFVISRQVYAFDPDEGDLYDKVTLTYFKRHRVIIDEEEDVIDDVPSVVGWKNLNQFGGESGDPNVVFIRNRQLNIDYEVVLDEENDPPLHVKYGMARDEFRTARASGVLKLRPEDEGD